jgi:succinate dehydrogenase / fumarate reductase cytochrome b subunit
VLEVTRRGIWSTTVGKKAVMGVTGLLMLLYVVVHMLANLKIFLGRDGIDSYAVWLRTFLDGALGYAGFVWIVRVGLVLCVVLHMTAGYQHRSRVQGSYAARTMRWGGVILALFVVYHILDLTAGVLNPNGVHLAVYDNVIADFQHWYVALFYALAVVALGFHIRHGLWSALQSLGASSAARQRRIQAVSAGVAVVITAGFLSVPFAVLTGLVG